MSNPSSACKEFCLPRAGRQSRRSTDTAKVYRFLIHDLDVSQSILQQARASYVTIEVKRDHGLPCHMLYPPQFWTKDWFGRSCLIMSAAFSAMA